MQHDFFPNIQIGIMLTPGRILYHARRELSRGAASAWHEHAVARRILKWRAPAEVVARPPEPIPIHCLAGPDTWLCAGWMIASWFAATGRNWRVFFHDDGRTTPEMAGALARLIPHFQFVPAGEADARMAPLLAEAPRCRAYRDAHPLGRKAFDMPALTAGERFLMIDADVLFFRRPEAILRWADATGEEAQGLFFNEDPLDPAPISHEEAAALGVADFQSRTNSGLCLLRRDAIRIADMERWLGLDALREGRAWRIEQTLLALAASATGRCAMLPPEYEVSLGKNAAHPDPVARHYVGAVRPRFWAEGVRRLKGRLL